jgi:hypothetical protein
MCLNVTCTSTWEVAVTNKTYRICKVRTIKICGTIWEPNNKKGTNCSSNPNIACISVVRKGIDCMTPGIGKPIMPAYYTLVKYYYEHLHVYIHMRYRA